MSAQLASADSLLRPRRRCSIRQLKYRTTRRILLSRSSSITRNASSSSSSSSSSDSSSLLQPLYSPSPTHTQPRFLSISRTSRHSSFGVTSGARFENIEFYHCCFTKDNTRIIYYNYLKMHKRHTVEPDDKEKQTMIPKTLSDEPEFEVKGRKQDNFDRLEALGNWLWVKFQAICWIAGALFIVYESNFFRQLFHNDNVNELFLTISLLCIGMMIALTVYSGFVLPTIMGVTEDIETYNPRLIHFGAFTGFLSFLTQTLTQQHITVRLLIAIWPVWGWWTFPMMFVLFLGFLNTAHFLPNHQIGGLLFGIIFIGAFFSHHFIDHEGRWH